MAIVGFSLLRADGTTAGPTQTQPADPDKEDFGKYLFDHQDDLAPIFQKNSDELVKQGVPMILKLAGTILLLNVVIGWFFDIGIGYGFSYLIARTVKAKGIKALTYATGRLVIIILLTLIAGVVAYVMSLLSPFLVLLVIGLIPLADIVVQTIWVAYIYRTNYVVSGLFYIWVLLAHVIAGSLLSGPMVESRGQSMVTQFIDQNVTEQVKQATEASQKDLTEAEAARDKAQQDLKAAQDRLDAANAKAEELKKEVEAKKNSDAYVYGQICRVHARGDLSGAQTQLSAFLTNYPSSSLIGAAKAQLAGIEADQAAEEVKEKEKEQAEIAAAAQARADFLTRAAKDGVTLSEARQMTLNKTRQEVTELLGAPTETGPDCWGFGHVVTVNPLTNEKHGLSIYFSEGKVLSVDYYYGGEAAK